MTARDVQTLIERSPDLEDLWRDVLYLSNSPGRQDYAAFSKDEVRAFVGYCMNAIESAPEVEAESGDIQTDARDIAALWTRNCPGQRLIVDLALTAYYLPTVGVAEPGLTLAAKCRQGRNPRFLDVQGSGVPAHTSFGAPKTRAFMKDETIDAWRSTSAWRENDDGHFTYVGEEPLFKIEHTATCMLVLTVAADNYLATRRCTCGALGDVANIKNPDEKRRARETQRRKRDIEAREQERERQHRKHMRRMFGVRR